jgi:hypothetical protein
MPSCNSEDYFQNLSREELLGRLMVGDIFHGIDEHVAVLLCLVVGVDEATIYSRRLTTQQSYKFDRKTGATISGDGWPEGSITSVEPLPSSIHSVFVEMDRQYRLGHRSEESVRLSASQKEALLFIHDYYARHPI